MSGDGLNARLIKRIDVTPGLAIMRVAPDGWELAPFAAGQYTTLGLPGSADRDLRADHDEKEIANPDKIIKRAYSISSSSKQGEYIEFYVTMVYSGALTPRLFALKEGDPVFMGLKNKGLFTLAQAPDHVNLAMIGTGTGLAPFMSMVRSTFQCGDDRKFAILHGARHSWDLGYRAELESLNHECGEFSYLPIISRPAEEAATWSGATGHVQQLWKDGSLATAWGFAPTPDDTHIYLCGAPAMIEDMVTFLEAEGYTEHSKKVPGQIHVERYW